MSENIYDILAKFPKDLPSSVKEVDPLYESVDSSNGLLESVRNLEEKFYKYKTDSKQENDPAGFKIAKAKREMQLAMAEYPEASSPEEAIVARMGDQAEETKKIIDNAKATIAKQQQEISKTAQAVNDANDRYAAQEQRFQEFNKQVAASNLDVKQQAQAALDYAKQPQAQPQDIIAQIQAKAPLAPTAPTAPTSEPTAQPEKAMPELPTQEQPAKEPAPTNVVDMDAERKKRAQQQARLAQQYSELPPLKQASGSDLRLEEAEAVDPDMADKNWGAIIDAAESDPPPVYTNLNFGKPTPLTLRYVDVLALYNYFRKKVWRNGQYDRVMLGKLIRSNFNDEKVVRKLLQTDDLKLARAAVKRMDTARFKARQTKMDYTKQQSAPKPATQAPAQQPQQPQQPGLKGTEWYKYVNTPRQRDLFRTDDMQENIKTNSILEGVRQVEDKKLKEAAKPDFLDLDKDGDTDEPMKSAAKSAKDHEPAKPDSDAVAKRKRLQALKDKQEDERAEKGDDDKSSSRFVKGRAYGGAAQKDDEDKDLDESGLQAYLGKKKYGKEGMKALQQAGREGASKEKMAMLRAKHDKMDEARPSRADKVTKDLTSIADKKGYKSAKDFTRQDWDKVAKPHGYTGKEIAAVRGHKVEEVAPPGAKAERMVKGIKKSLSKDGHLSGKDKAIAYATTWKARNKGQVEEATNFGDTIKNSAGKMTKVTVKEGKDAIRNHPIYTTKEAWDHYAEELAEQEMMEQSVMTPVVDVQQELDEIAKLAGLPVKTCEACDCAPCKCNENLAPMAPADSASPLTHTELDEAMSRKDYRSMANDIADMDNREDAERLARKFSKIAKDDNPRFKEEMFLAACGINVEECGSMPTAVVVGEADMEEGNEFSGALAAAKASGSKDFEVDGKKYTVKEDININVTANGEDDVVNLIRKLSGMEAIKTVTDKISAMSSEACGACGSSPCGCETVAEDGPKERDIEYTNTPREETAGIDASIPSGDDLHRAKKSYSGKPYRGDNPMAESKEDNLWTAYESMINDVKA